MNQEASHKYAKRIEAVCDYIAQHLKQPLTLEPRESPDNSFYNQLVDTHGAV